ncbi:MAG: hypothetical protein MJK04_17740, partial [Psychrosphaera sp.]|nr:hypothetical protein [Psychrosphaera sp.]
MNHLIKSSVALALLFSGGLSAEENLSVSPKQATVNEGVESLYTITATHGKFNKGDTIRIFIENDVEREFEIINISKSLYEYKNVSKVANKTKNRLVINAAKGVDKIRLVILFKDKAGKNTDTVESIKLAHSYDDVTGGKMTYMVGDTSKNVAQTDVKVKPDTPEEPVPLEVGARNDDGTIKPARYTISIENGKKLAAKDTITIATSAGASKVDISLDEEDGTYDEKTSQITLIKATDKLLVTVKPHKDIHNIKDMKFDLSNIYKKKDIGKIAINLKGNSAGMPCTTLDLNGIDKQYKGSCFNVHMGIHGSFSNDGTFKPNPYTMLISRSVLWSDADKDDKSKSKNKYKAEGFFEAELYQLPALVDPITTTEISKDESGKTTTKTTETTEDTDTSPFTQKNNVYKLAAGFKFPISTSKWSFVTKVGARKVPSQANTFNNTPVFYQLGLERAVNFVNNGTNQGRGIAGFAFAKDEFWQYNHNKTAFNYKDRVIIYGSVALNDARTVL